MPPTPYGDWYRHTQSRDQSRKAEAAQLLWSINKSLRRFRTIENIAIRNALKIYEVQTQECLKILQTAAPSGISPDNVIQVPKRTSAPKFLQPLTEEREGVGSPTRVPTKPKTSTGRKRKSKTPPTGTENVVDVSMSVVASKTSPISVSLSYPAPPPAPPPRFVIFGAPASGKGTQTEALVAKYGMVHISTGDLLRSSVLQGTAFGLAAGEAMAKGQLVSDELIVGMVCERLASEEVQERGFLLDGFPRTAKQAAALAEKNIPVDKFIVLDVPFEVLEERVTGRVVDPQTGNSYHLKYKPPPPEVAGRCIQRKDDTKEALVKRLELFSTNLGNVVSFYQSQAVHVNGNQAPDLVAKEMLAAISNSTSGSGKEVVGRGSMAASKLASKPYSGQKPGTSGLRKKTKLFMEGTYLHNFVHATLEAAVLNGSDLGSTTLVVGGDGRFYNPEAVQVILKIAAAKGCRSFVVGREGLLSTPAASAVVRGRAVAKPCCGAFILSASHNPGGPEEDFGIKYNCENGGPAPEKVTNAIYDITTKLDAVDWCAGFPDIDLAVAGVTTVVDGDDKCIVEVFDPVEDHVKLLKDIFDFGKIKALLARQDFSFVYDSMHGVQGPYAKAVFVDELGADPSVLMNAEPKDDFGGGHADPNLTYAKDLTARMGVDAKGDPVPGVDPATVPCFGAAADGDADRNMILGRQFFVSPSDSLAVIVEHADHIPGIKKRGGLRGVARSMPTSGAVDRVAEAKGLQCFETPTGWKFFGNLMDSKCLFGGKDYTPFICGEESFGTGSDHVREKDGMWAVLAWLQIIASYNEDSAAPFVHVEDILKQHWAKYGRNYYCRYDYEGVASEAAAAMFDKMTAETKKNKGYAFKSFTIDTADVFEYTDPVDGSVSKNQGWRFLMTDGSRFVFRQSGTGSVGATIRMYLEKYEPPTGSLHQRTADVVGELIDMALELSKLAKFTGRDAPTVIT